MPIIPSTYGTNMPLTAHQLNQDMYTYDGTYFGANGVMFHSNRPLLVESYSTNSVIAAAKGGSFTTLGGVNGNAISILDNAGLFGSGADTPADAASFRSQGAIGPGSTGVAGQFGGWMLFSAFVNVNSFSGTNNTFGVLWNFNTNAKSLPVALTDIGCMVQGSTTRNNCSFAIDLIQRNPNSGNLYAPGVFALDPAGTSIDVVANTSSTSGQTPRFVELWAGVLNGNGLTVSSIPVPMTVCTTASTLTSATLNTTIQQTFNLLNNPPMLNVASQNTGSTSANTPRQVPFITTPLIDNYSCFATATTTYTVKIPGIYFCHANIIYNTSFNNGSAMAGFSVNTTTFWGGAYNATPPGQQNTGSSVTKVLDLNAGDTVTVVAQTSAGAGFGQSNVSHFIMLWMCPISGSNPLPWEPPDVTGFNWSAGYPPGTVLNGNPYFANSGAGWAGFDGNFGTTGSPPVTGPYGTAGAFTITTSGAGACMRESGALFTAASNTQYCVSAWVYSTLSTCVLGFEWRDQNGNIISTAATTTFNITPGVWQQVVSTQTSSPGTSQGCPRLAPTDGVNNTIYAEGVVVTQGQPPLVNQMQSKLVNDVNFLLNRPYCTVHQTSTNTGLSVNAWHSPTMQSTVGLVHSSIGDNYNGWNVANNAYAAPVNGWYLAVSEINAATNSTVNSQNSLIAGLSVPTSGGINSPTSGSGPPDWYQNMLVTNVWTYPTGCTAMGVYYLLDGETIAPTMQYQAASGTWATDVTHGFESHFNVIWLSN